MATYGEVLAVLDNYRIQLEQGVQAEAHRYLEPQDGVVRAFAARGGTSAFSTPLSNVHASGIGARVRGGEVIPDEFVLKLYVFDKIDLADPPELSRAFEGIEVDVEPLPIQKALQVPQRGRHRPVIGGISIAPINEAFVGTLGCFLRGSASGTEQIFALSNNHVLADTNRLPIGTAIVQPGPEVGPTRPGDVFAALSSFVPIDFPASRADPVRNRVDAAIAIVSDRSLIAPGQMFGIANYTPQLLAPVPQMRVIKSGRTTGVTRGTIIATRVRGVQVDYGSPGASRVATFDDAITILGDGGKTFSMPGDSGSVILEESSGRPVALLFAGDGRTTTACDLGAVCQRFGAFPV